MAIGGVALRAADFRSQVAVHHENVAPAVDFVEANILYGTILFCIWALKTPER